MPAHNSQEAGPTRDSRSQYGFGESGESHHHSAHTPAEVMGDDSVMSKASWVFRVCRVVVREWDCCGGRAVSREPVFSQRANLQVVKGFQTARLIPVLRAETSLPLFVTCLRVSTAFITSRYNIMLPRAT